MNWYEEKLEAKRDRLLARAAKKSAEARSREKTARSMMEAIPFGQPILVGHHSEKRDRSFRKRMNGNFSKAFEAQQDAEGLRSRAESVGTAGISSDDPEAITKLREMVARLEEARANEKKANAAMRKAAKKFAKEVGRELTRTEHAEIAKGLEGIPADYRAALVSKAMVFGWLPKFEGNTNANLKRYKDRLALLEKRAAEEDRPDIETEHYTVSEDRTYNRLQIEFAGMPPEAVRKWLKSNGFRWARSLGVWQRQISNRARYLAEVELPKLWEDSE